MRNNKGVRPTAAHPASNHSSKLQKVKPNESNMGKEGKEKKAKISDKEAEKIILQYLEKQNRPYNATTLFENLHGAVGKSQAVKVTQDMADKGTITQKEFGKQKLFWRKQEGLEDSNPEALANLDKEIQQYEEQVSVLQEEVNALLSAVKTLKSAPNNQEADERIAKLTKDNAELSQRLKHIKENQNLVTPQEKKKVEKEYDNVKQQWKKRKRMCRDILGSLEEGSGKRLKDLKEDIGFEDDVDVGVDPDNDLTTKMKKGEV